MTANHLLGVPVSQSLWLPTHFTAWTLFDSLNSNWPFFYVLRPLIRSPLCKWTMLHLKSMKQRPTQHSNPIRIAFSIGNLHRSLWHCHVQRVQNNIWILLWSIVFARPPHANSLLATRGHSRGLRHKLPSTTRYVHPVRLCRRAAAVRSRGVIFDSHRLRGGWCRGRGSCRSGCCWSFRIRVHWNEFLYDDESVTDSVGSHVRTRPRKPVDRRLQCQVHRALAGWSS